MTSRAGDPASTHGPQTLGPQAREKWTYPPRRTLSSQAARILADAHARTGATYRTVAASLGIDYGYWRRLTLGHRAPSAAVAIRIIDHFDLDPKTAGLLLDEAVTKNSGCR